MSAGTTILPFPSLRDMGTTSSLYLLTLEDSEGTCNSRGRVSPYSPTSSDHPPPALSDSAPTSILLVMDASTTMTTLSDQQKQG